MASGRAGESTTSTSARPVRVCAAVTDTAPVESSASVMRDTMVGLFGELHCGRCSLVTCMGEDYDHNKKLNIKGMTFFQFPFHVNDFHDFFFLLKRLT